MADEEIYDPTKFLLDDLQKFGKDDQTLIDLQTNPAGIQLLLQMHEYNLHQLGLNKKELADEKNKTYKQTEMITDLKVKLAETNERKNLVWIEIPTSLFGGYAINLLANDIHNTTGLIILIFVIIILLLLRSADIIGYFQVLRKGKDND